MITATAKTKDLSVELYIEHLLGAGAAAGTCYRIEPRQAEALALQLIKAAAEARFNHLLYDARSHYIGDVS